jgi:replicative DNA helicase
MAAEANTHLRLVLNEPPAVDGRVPPHDLETEVATLAALLIDETTIARVKSWLRPEHFYAEAHRRIYEAILAVSAGGFKPGEQACLIRVGAWLNDRSRIKQIGGMAYLTEILNSAPAIANIEKYGTIVYEKWRARQVIATCQRVAAEGYVDYGEAQIYADGAAKALTDIARASVGGDIESNLAALKRLITEIRNNVDDAIKGKRSIGILTGLGGYDAETGGLHAGEKTTIGALSGVGKTALAMQVADHVASQGIGVLVFTNEDSREKVLLRMLARRANVDGKRLKAGRISEGEWDRIIVAVKEIHPLPLVIDDTEGMTIGHVITRMRLELERFRRTQGKPLGLVVLDWIQNFEREPEDSRSENNRFIARCTRAYAQALKDMKIPGIETAQQKDLGIDKTTRLRPKPSKGQIAETSWIEKLAAHVWYLHRNPLLNRQKNVVGEDSSSISMVITKARGSEEGELQLAFDPAVQQFECLSKGFHDQDDSPPPPDRRHVDRGNGKSNHDYASRDWREDR